MKKKSCQQSFNDALLDCDGILEFLRSIPKSKCKAGRNQIMASIKKLLLAWGYKFQTLPPKSRDSTIWKAFASDLKSGFEAKRSPQQHIFQMKEVINTALNEYIAKKFPPPQRQRVDVNSYVANLARFAHLVTYKGARGSFTDTHSSLDPNVRLINLNNTDGRHQYKVTAIENLVKLSNSEEFEIHAQYEFESKINSQYLNLEEEKLSLLKINSNSSQVNMLTTINTELRNYLSFSHGTRDSSGNHIDNEMVEATKLTMHSNLRKLIQLSEGL